MVLPVCPKLGKVCLLIVLALLAPVMAFADDPYDQSGAPYGRGFFAPLPWERIDTVTGNLFLSFTDLTLPGNAGMNLSIVCSYNSRDGRWRFGIAGAPLSCLYTSIDDVTFITADGGRHQAAGAGGQTMTQEFWRFTKSTRSSSGASTTRSDQGSRRAHARRIRTAVDGDGEDDESNRRILNNPLLKSSHLSESHSTRRSHPSLFVAWLFNPSRCRRPGYPAALNGPYGTSSFTRSRELGLRAELAMRQDGPDGKRLPPSGYVFGNELGERRTNIRRDWEDAVLRVHGIEPLRKRGKLTEDCRVAFFEIDLDFRDLRREFASRLLESSADIHDVQMFLGHANITQTSTYLSSTPTRLQGALKKLEAAGFAQSSHKTTESSPADGEKTTVESAVTH
jgi:hypothetical protein